MSGKKVATITVAQSQYDALRREASRANREAYRAGQLEGQLAASENRRRQDLATYQANLASQIAARQRDNERLLARIEGTGVELRSAIEAQNSDFKRRLGEVNDRMIRECNATRRDISDVRDALQAQSVACSTELREVRTALENQIQEVNSQTRREIDDRLNALQTQFREELDGVQHDIQAMRAGIEQDRERTRREREIAERYSYTLRRTYMDIVNDLSDFHSVETVCPDEYLLLTSNYNSAVNAMQIGVDPVAGYVMMSNVIQQAIALRGRVLAIESNVIGMRTRLQEVLADYRAVSARDYMRMGAKKERGLYVLEDYSDGELEEFRSALEELSGRIERASTITEMEAFAEDVSSLRTRYERIVDNADLRENFSESLKEKARDLIDRTTERGMRFECLLARSGFGFTIVLSCRGFSGNLNRVAIDLDFSLENENGEYAPRICCGQRAFVIGNDGNLLENYDPEVVGMAIETVENCLGVQLNVAAGATEGIAAGESDYADIGNALAQLEVHNTPDGSAGDAV